MNILLYAIVILCSWKTSHNVQHYAIPMLIPWRPHSHTPNRILASLIKYLYPIKKHFVVAIDKLNVHFVSFKTFSNKSKVNQFQ